MHSSEQVELRIHSTGESPVTFLFLILFCAIFSVDMADFVGNHQYVATELKNILRLARKDSALRSFSSGNSWKIESSPHHGGKTSKGVFATKTIFPNQVLGEYRGATIHVLPNIANSHYSVHISGTNITIDATCPSKSSWPRYINRPNKNQIANVTFEAFVHPDNDNDVRVVIQATKKIRKNQQLLANYKH